MCEVGERRPVELRRHYDVRSGPGDGEDGIADGGHARRHDESRRAVLQRGDALLQHFVGRIVEAVVVETRHLEIQNGAGVRRVLEVVRHGQIDGHRHSPGAIGFVATMDGNRLVVHMVQSLLFEKPLTQLA